MSFQPDFVQNKGRKHDEDDGFGIICRWAHACIASPVATPSLVATPVSCLRKGERVVPSRREMLALWIFYTGKVMIIASDTAWFGWGMTTGGRA